jgi:hypothetical protein
MIDGDASDALDRTIDMTSTPLADPRRASLADAVRCVHRGGERSA